MVPLSETLVPRALEIDVISFAEVKSIIENANAGDIINLNIKNDLMFTSSVVMKTNLTINITNGSGGDEVILSYTTGGNFRHFSTNPSGAASLADVPNLSMTISEGVVLDGNATSGGIGFYSSGGQLTLNGCSVINCVRSGSGEAGNGGGLWVGGSTAPCVLAMRDVLIANCTANSGGGIHISSGAVATMYNGKITGNIAGAVGSNGGGVYVFAATASFNMNGGTISNNTATNGGGVFNLSGTFTMSGNAAIIDNTATNNAGTAGNGGGVFNSGGHFIMNGGAISGNVTARIGGGVRNNGVNALFDMRGGEIRGNTSLGDVGGGVTNMSGATFNLYDGRISGNESMVFSGGGVNNQASTLVMTGGEISGNTATSGGGVLNWSGGGFIMEGGTISDNITMAAEGRGGGVFNFGPATFVMRGGAITGHTTASYGGGINNTGADAFVTIESGIIEGNTATVDGGGIWIAHENLANLAVGPDAVFVDNSASGAFNRNPIDDELYFSRIFGTRWTWPFTQGYNNFDISYTYGTPFAFPVEVFLQGTLRVTGAPLPGGSFVFGVFDQSGDLVVTATADVAGNINFPALTFTEPGTFHFTLREITPARGGWTADTSVFPAIITVIDNGEGQLIATVDYPYGPPSFTSTHTQPQPQPAPATVTLRATKRVCGACLRAGCFAFGLYDQCCNEVGRASNDRDGNVIFPELTFTEPGVHCYTMRELSFSNSCWITDTRAHTVFIAITKNSAGQLIANVNYPKGQPVFINWFCPS